MPCLHLIQQLDDHFGVQIPEKFLEQIGVQKNDDVEISCQGNMIVIRKFAAPELAVLNGVN